MEELETEEFREWVDLFLKEYPNAQRLGELSTKFYAAMSRHEAPAQFFDRLIKKFADEIIRNTW